MEEFKFVLKCFLFACVVVVFSQTKIQNETLESKAFAFLQHSEVARLVRATAGGGVKLIQQGYESSKNFIEEKMSGQNSSSAPQSRRPIYSSRIASAQKEKAQQGGAAEPLGGQSRGDTSSSNEGELLEEDRF